jgi:hypothetical protein
MHTADQRHRVRDGRSGDDACCGQTQACNTSDSGHRSARVPVFPNNLVAAKRMRPHARGFGSLGEAARRHA